MKTIVKLPVSFLRIYPVEREVTSTNGVKGTRAGALVLSEMLPHSPDQKESNTIELSGKQLTNLASIHGIQLVGRKGWAQLQGLMQVGDSVAEISVEEHQKGDKYVTSDGEEKEFAMTSTNCGVNAIILSASVRKQLVAKTIDAIINYDEDDEVAKILKGSGVEEFEVADVK